MKKDTPNISIIIPTYNRKNDLCRLLASIDRLDYPKEEIEVIVVDNASTVEEADLRLLLTKQKLVLVQPPSNLFCNGGRLFGAERANGKLLFFIDDDNILEKDSLKNMAKHFDKSNELGVVAPLTLFFSNKDRIWLAGVKLNMWGIPKYLYGGKDRTEIELPETIDDLDSFPNAFMTTRKVLNTIPFDVINFPHNWSEADFALRLKHSGFKSLVDTTAISWHDIGYTGQLTRIDAEKIYDQAKSRILFRKRFKHGLFNWLAFWIVVFPASSAVYLKQILAKPVDKILIIKQYFKGTSDGLRTQISKI